jgi:hypothetical protein
LLRGGTIVDATLIAASPSTKNEAGRRDPEMRSSKKGNHRHALASKSQGPIGGSGKIIQGDETFVGGKAKNVPPTSTTNIAEKNRARIVPVIGIGCPVVPHIRLAVIPQAGGRSSHLRRYSLRRSRPVGSG